MLDAKHFREELEQTAEQLKSRGFKLDVATLQQLEQPLQQHDVTVDRRLHQLVAEGRLLVRFRFGHRLWLHCLLLLLL